MEMELQHWYQETHRTPCRRRGTKHPTLESFITKVNSVHSDVERPPTCNNLYPIVSVGMNINLMKVPS